MKSKVKGGTGPVAEDPRRPVENSGTAFEFRGFVNSQQDKGTDYWILAALLFGLVALIFKYRVFVLNSVVCCIISFANLSYAEFDAKQFISAIFISLMGLFVAYVGPQANQFL